MAKSLLTPPTLSVGAAALAEVSLGASTVTVGAAKDDLSRGSGEMCSAAAGTNRVKALIVRPSPMKDSVKTAAASDVATATIASERLVQRLGGGTLSVGCMQRDVHEPFQPEQLRRLARRAWRKGSFASLFCHNGAK